MMRNHGNEFRSRAAAVLGSVALTIGSTALAAGPPCCAPVESCAPVSYGPTCLDCEQVFQQAGDDLAVELCGLMQECCEAPCCDVPGCDEVACDDVGCDGSGCGLCDGELGDPWTLWGAIHDDPCNEPCFQIGGWTQIGYHNRSTGLFNDQPDRLNLHQQWFWAERVADGSEGLDFGFRVDFMYGIDGHDTQAFGNTPGRFDFQNGWDRGKEAFAMPQLYGEVAMGDLSVRVGHFYTLLGYEVVPAPDNFFYSHAFTMYNSEAFTHTGALATYNASDTLTLYGGYTLGWDTGFDQYDLNRQHGSSFLGGFSSAMGENATFTYITTFGDLGWVGDGYTHSIVIDTALTDNLSYVFQSDYFDTHANEPVALFGPGVTDIETIGINQYLFYTISERLAVGGRAEWWKNDSDSVGAITGGVNIRPIANLVIRPEIRYQWDPGADNAGIASEGDGIFGVDAILTY